MVNLRQGCNGGFSTSLREALFNGDAGRQSLDVIDVGALQLLYELAGVRRHAIHETPLAFRKQDIKRQTGFSRPAQARDNHHLLLR